jgi:hypothetical protein
VELTEPEKALDQAGAETQIVSSKNKQSPRLEVHGMGALSRSYAKVDR